MDIVIQIAQFVLAFSLLVFVHELGHILFARLFKVRVDRFYIFFDPWFSLFKFKRGDTTYGLGWIPFGGYCKIAGMIDESMDSEQTKQPPQPYEFRSKPAWQRLLIMLGGVMMNVVLAFAIYIGISTKWGETYIANEDVTYGYVFNDLGHELGFEDGDRILNVAGEEVRVSDKVFQTIALEQAPYVTIERAGAPLRIDIPEGAVAKLIKSKDFMTLRLPFHVGAAVEKGGAAAAGIVAGDRLVAFNGEPMRFFDQYTERFAAHKGDTVQLGIERDSAGVKQLLTLPVLLSEAGQIGVQLQPIEELLTVSTYTFNFWQAIPQAVKLTGEQLASVGNQIKMLVSPETEAYKSLGGLISIGSVFPTQWNWHLFWSITAFFSVMLALMNVLPIPALDGGHVLFLLVEVITRRKPSDKFIERAQLVGLILVFSLLLYANGNDIYRLFIK